MCQSQAPTINASSQAPTLESQSKRTNNIKRTILHIKRTILQRTSRRCSMLSSAASCASLRAMPTHTLTCRQHGPRVISYLCQSRAPETNNKNLGRADPFGTLCQSRDPTVPKYGPHPPGQSRPPEGLTLALDGSGYSPTVHKVEVYTLHPPVGRPRWCIPLPSVFQQAHTIIY